jgi:biopolymer transport protein ExbD
MAISTGGAEDAPMSDINTTPLVDVMLVLLIIFLITVPAIVQSVKLKLPDVKYDPTDHARTRRRLRRLLGSDPRDA